ALTRDGCCVRSVANITAPAALFRPAVRGRGLYGGTRLSQTDMKSHASGQVYIWQGGSLWIGRSHGTTDTHAHHAIQISLALDGTFRLKTPGDPAWPTYSAALVPSHQPHALSTSSAVTATTFVEPEAYEGRILLERYGGSGVVPLPEAL